MSQSSKVRFACISHSQPCRTDTSFLSDPVTATPKAKFAPQQTSLLSTTKYACLSLIPLTTKPNLFAQFRRLNVNAGDPYLAALDDIDPLPRADGAIKAAYAALKKGDNQDNWTEKCEVRVLAHPLSFHIAFMR